MLELNPQVLVLTAWTVGQRAGHKQGPWGQGMYFTTGGRAALSALLSSLCPLMSEHWPLAGRLTITASVPQGDSVGTYLEIQLGLPRICTGLPLGLPLPPLQLG